MEPEKIDEEHTEHAERQPTAVVGGDYTADYSSSSVYAAAAAGPSNDNDRDGLFPPLFPCSSSNAKRLKRDRENCVGTHLQSQSCSQEEEAARCCLLLSRDGAERTPVPNLKLSTTPPIFHPTHHANNSLIESQNCNAANQNFAAAASINSTSTMFPAAASTTAIIFTTDTEIGTCINEMNVIEPGSPTIALNSTITKTTIASAASVNSTSTMFPVAASTTAITFTSRNRNEVNAIEPGNPTIPLLYNSFYHNKILNVTPKEQPIDMHGSWLRLLYSDAKSLESGWDTQPKRNMDLEEEGSQTLPLLYNSSYLNKVINIPTEEAPTDMDGSWLRLWYSNAESPESGHDAQLKRNMNLGEVGSPTLPLLYNSSYLNKVINIPLKQSPIDMDGSWLRLWYSDAESPEFERETQQKRNMDLGEEGIPTLPLLYNCSHLNKAINIALEPLIDMDGSGLQLWYSDAESSEPGWDTQRNMDMVEEVGQKRKRQ